MTIARKPLLLLLPRLRRAARGFTLLELMVVVSIIALASAGVGLAMRDGGEQQLEREAARLAALLEAARAQSRASGVAVRWQPVAGGFRFAGALPGSLPERWLAADTLAELSAGTGAAMPWPASGSAASRGTALVLGPEPLIGAQAVLLRQASQPQRALRVATDGLRPFAVSSVDQ